MHHVRSIETVVPELVKDDLVRREIIRAVREGPASLVDSQEEGGLAQLVAVCPVLQVAYRRNREDESLFWEVGDKVLAKIIDTRDKQIEFWRQNNF